MIIKKCNKYVNLLLYKILLCKILRFVSPYWELAIENLKWTHCIFLVFEGLRYSYLRAILSYQGRSQMQRQGTSKRQSPRSCSQTWPHHLFLHYLSMKCLGFIFKDEIKCLIYAIKFSKFLWKFQTSMNFWRKNEENSYQIQITLKESEIFKIEVHYNVSGALQCKEFFLALLPYLQCGHRSSISNFTKGFILRIFFKIFKQNRS